MHADNVLFYIMLIGAYSLVVQLIFVLLFHCDRYAREAWFTSSSTLIRCAIDIVHLLLATRSLYAVVMGKYFTTILCNFFHRYDTVAHSICLSSKEISVQYDWKDGFSEFYKSYKQKIIEVTDLSKNIVIILS